MTDLGFLSVLPPILAILLAIRTKQVIVSLLVGLWLGYTLILGGNPLSGLLLTVERIVNVFESEGNTRTILFTLLIGSLIQIIRFSGGIDGFVGYVKSTVLKSKNPGSRLQVGAALTGFLIFIESNISILTVGTVFQPLFKQYKISMQKLAYLADSSSAPSCILFPINAWGAYIIGLLATYDHIAPFKTLLYSIPFNLYPILTLLLVFYLASTNRSFGPMKSFDLQMEDTEPTVNNSATNSGKPQDMILPLGLMIITMPIFLVYTGWGLSEAKGLSGKLWDAVANGSGSAAVLYAVLTALLFAGVYFGIKKKIGLNQFIEESISGMKDMLSMALLMLLAFAIGSLCKEMGTGNYVAGVTEPWLSPAMAPAIIFLTSCFIAFSTGTSWGTFAIMISIAIPLAQAIDVNLYLALAAVLGGGVFGDHCSPISDTTLIASMASGSDHIDHVKTQLPYALVTGGATFILYLILGWLLH